MRDSGWRGGVEGEVVGVERKGVWVRGDVVGDGEGMEECIRGVGGGKEEGGGAEFGGMSGAGPKRSVCWVLLFSIDVGRAVRGEEGEEGEDTGGTETGESDGSGGEGGGCG